MPSDGLTQLVVTFVRSTKLLYAGRRARISTGMGDRIGVQLLVREIYLSLTSLAIPPCGRRNEYPPKGGDALRLGVKADMVLSAGNTVWSKSERVRGVCAYIDALYKSTYTLLYFSVVGWGGGMFGSGSSCPLIQIMDVRIMCCSAVIAHANQLPILRM